METRLGALAFGIGLVFGLVLGIDGAAAQSVTVIRGGTKAEAPPSAVEIVRGRGPQPPAPVAQAAPGIGVAGHAAFLYAPGDVAFVNCPQGATARSVNCRVRIAPPARKRDAF